MLGGFGEPELFGLAAGEDVDAFTCFRVPAGIVEEIQLPFRGRVVEDAYALEALAQGRLLAALSAP